MTQALVAASSGHAQTSASGYVPTVVVSSVSMVPVPTLVPPFTGSETNVMYPTDVALDSCGNIYTIDVGPQGSVPNTGNTLTEIPANGGPAVVVTNVGEYNDVHLGQDPTRSRLVIGVAYDTGGSAIPLVNCVPQPALAQHVGSGNGNFSPLFYYYNAGYFVEDFVGNTYISTQATCCITGNFYLVQAETGTSNILLSDQAAEIQSMAVDKNQNIYFISAGILYELEFLAGDGAYTTTPVVYGTAYSDPVGVSVDVAGNLYIADQGVATIYEIPNEMTTVGQTALNAFDQFVVSTGVTSTVSVAIDAQGDLYFPGPSYYAAGTSAGSIDKLSLGKAEFGIVAIGQSATRTINFQFNGHVALAAVNLPTGVFAADAGVGSAPCTAGVTYAPGGNDSNCTVVLTFAPKTAGKQSSAVVLKDTKGNSIATAYLNGTGQGAAMPAGTTTTLTADPSTNLVAGQPITLTASVTPVSGQISPTGSVTFADPAGGSVQMLLVDGKASYYGKVPPVGTYSVYASYNGGPGFAESKSATITRAVTAP